MKKLLFISILSLIPFSMFQAISAKKTQIPSITKMENLQKIIKQNPKLIIHFFNKENIMCTYMVEEVETKILKQLSKIKVKLIHVPYPESKAIIEKYDIKNSATYLFLKKGEVIKTIVNPANINEPQTFLTETEKVFK